MKTNKEDIRLLKSKHRLELVMQEAGESFEVDAENSNQWRSKLTTGLTVDIHRQMYEFSRPGMDTETGDVIAWLRRRYTWDFGKAIKFLQNRAADPIQEARPIKVKKTKQPQPQQSDYVIISNYHVNPITGSESYGMDFNYSIMDDLQKRALDLWHDAYKYFDKSVNEVWDKFNNYPSRFKPVIDFSIDKCANCETSFNWKEYGAIAYAEEREEFITVCGESEDGKEFSGQLAEVDELFIDQDFVICEKCLRSIYAPRYEALRLVYSSSKRRAKAVEEERERERKEERQWICEQQQLMNESELSP